MKTKNIAVGALVGFLMLALWFNFLLKPTNAKVTKVKADTDIERGKLQPLQAQLAQANIDAAHADTFKARLAVLKDAVPDSPDLANFIRGANDLAVESNLEWLSVTHSTPTADATGVSSIAVGIQVKGTYEQVLDYLGRIAKLKRLVIVDAVGISAAGTTGAGTGESGSAVNASTGPFSGASEVAVVITARMFLTPQDAATATGGTAGTGATTTPVAAPTPGGASTLNNS